jgi:hypothetical protein
LRVPLDRVMDEINAGVVAQLGEEEAERLRATLMVLGRVAAPIREMIQGGEG